MLCDDCTQSKAEYHMGHGICLCEQCARNFDAARVMEKIQQRNLILKQLAEGEYVPFETLKIIPVEYLMS